ncbi:NAD-dependent protein deacylase [Roseivivax jejudonensis]|uniref:NAD-dependent protein deacylase n=1 Tax=Roseivivax jejudonensis TaxID=1529041 RepID=A0A1X6ZED3_9RHOB|nr:Sir2 family NAD-dependent protein deacetylase [Roseivivax jejudonensis]SLN48866.1 NAD-dependent protein deacylase [Roseivivax jejudonensis]
MRDGKIVILTGAGISAESGLATFRDAGGLWEHVRLEDVATPEAFARNPDTVHAFYNMRRAQAAAAAPNAAHAALARLQAAHPDTVIVTQNVDALHERAGATVIHMHGALAGALCAACDHRWAAPPEMDTTTACPACQHPAARPDVVWFGEMPYHMETIAGHLETADLFVAIGTSGQVYPAAGFVAEARRAGARTLELNLAASDVSAAFDAHEVGPASTIVPAWVHDMLAG